MLDSSQIKIMSHKFCFVCWKFYAENLLRNSIHRNHVFMNFVVKPRASTFCAGKFAVLIFSVVGIFSFSAFQLTRLKMHFIRNSSDSHTGSPTEQPRERGIGEDEKEEIKFHCNFASYTK